MAAAPVTTGPGITTPNSALLAANENAAGITAGTSIPVTKPVTSISTEQGVAALNKTQQTAANLSPAPALPAGGATPSNYGTTVTLPDGTKSFVATPSYIGPNSNTPVSMQGSYLNGGQGQNTAPSDTPESSTSNVTLINPDTGQSISFDNPEANQDTIQSYLNSGYSVSEASGQIPSWLGPTGVSSNPTLDEANAGLQQASSDLATAKSNLANIDTSNDPQLQQLLQSISDTWDNRISAMSSALDSHVSALTSTGIRLGSQWTGGLAGMTGSLISGEEQANAEKISDLETQKQNALASAQSAYQQKKWTQYYDLVNQAQTAYDAQLSSIKSLQTAQSTQDAKIQAATEDATRAIDISKLYAQGTTDPADILKSLNDGGDTTATAADVSSILKQIEPTAATNDTFKFSQGQNSQLLAAGLSPDEIQALHDFYNGNGDSSAMDNLTPTQKSAVQDALNGTASKIAGSKVPTYAQANAASPTKNYNSGSLSYTQSTLGAIQTKLTQSKGSDGYVDPNLYEQAFDAWTQDGGLAKDFLKNFPTKAYINPANQDVPAYIESKTTTSSSSSSTGTVTNPFSS